LYAILGVTFNIVLLSIILNTKSSGLKGYAIIIANGACVDITQILIDALEIPRMVAYDEYSILIFHGFCTYIGNEFCVIMLHLIFHSLWLIAYLFWYRYTLLIKAAPSRIVIQVSIMILFIPNAVPMIISMFARDEPEKSVEILGSLYPGINITTTTHRSVSLLDPYSAPTDLSAIFGPFIVYTFIAIVRRKILRKLSTLAHKMSCKTTKMYESLVRALTYHTVLPVTICIGVASFYLQIIGIRSSLIDGLIFVFASIPAVCKPLLTIYFVVPYRR
ncbi:hypothetical protein PMAYCL1PPCAC_15795, partial [Pristionchus mayeri]